MKKEPTSESDPLEIEMKSLIRKLDNEIDALCKILENTKAGTINTSSYAGLSSQE